MSRIILSPLTREDKKVDVCTSHQYSEDSAGFLQRRPPQLPGWRVAHEYFMVGYKEYWEEMKIKDREEKKECRPCPEISLQESDPIEIRNELIKDRFCSQQEGPESFNRILIFDCTHRGSVYLLIYLKDFYMIYSPLSPDQEFKLKSKFIH